MGINPTPLRGIMKKARDGYTLHAAAVPHCLPLFRTRLTVLTVASSRIPPSLYHTSIPSLGLDPTGCTL
jgi:hypothetical protein